MSAVVKEEAEAVEERRRGARPLLLHAAGADLSPIAHVLAADAIETRVVDSLDDAAGPCTQPCVFLLDEAMAEATHDLAATLRHLPEAVTVIATGEPASRLAAGCDRVAAVLAADPAVAAGTLRMAFRLAAARLGTARMEAELARTRGELRELTSVGMALMTERDPARLLERIVEKARQITDSDAGSLYLVEPGEDGRPRLRFNLAQNDTLPGVPMVSFTLPLDPTSLAGYAAVTGETLRVADAYQLPPEAPYTLNRSFDQRFGYRTKSLLVVPMIDHAGDVVGVLQLINRKRIPAARIVDEDDAARWVLPYTDREQVLVQALAGQAAVSIENSRLYRQIEGLFESFVKAAVIAVDSRDPTTAGHSVRVATLTCDLAAGLERAPPPAYGGVRFTAEQMRELRYAALLHDFGKVGVREEVLVKAKKLPPLLMERVLSRFELVRRTLEAEYHQARAAALERGSRPGPELDAEHRLRLEELEAVRTIVLRANEPSVLPERAAETLERVGHLTFRGPDDQPVPYVTEEEMRFLHIPKGSLNDEERREIESHVEQTYRFLVQIPWTGELRNVAHIAYGHHEKLNGCGYPRGVTADQIPVQTRLMTVSDIFDALTAADRPYKRALTTERALDILTAEAREGLLDADLVRLLVESQAYRRILDVDWRDL
ncbi:MAG TPA: HD domain-containing phosphohydrolase [Longimicrobium sp.]|nr:HD domain-containing phosphohydrolase [Longimicrobium sp.]